MFRLRAPPPDLADYVAALWAVPLHRDLQARGERVIPDGCCELVIHCGDRMLAAHLDATPATQPLALLHGQLERSLRLWPATQVGMVAARFRPHGLFGLFGIPPQALAGAAIDLVALFGREADALLEQVREAFDIDAQWQHLIAFLRRQRRPSRTAPWLAAASAELDRADSRIDGVAQAAGISTRSLERAFRSAVGLEPKQFQLLRRVAASATRLPGDEGLAQIALDAGFADQSHYTRVFRSIAGCTPREFRHEQRVAAGWVPGG